MCWFDRNTARRGRSVVPLTCEHRMETNGCGFRGRGRRERGKERPPATAACAQNSPAAKRGPHLLADGRVALGGARATRGLRRLALDDRHKGTAWRLVEREERWRSTCCASMDVVCTAPPAVRDHTTANEPRLRCAFGFSLTPLPSKNSPVRGAHARVADGARLLQNIFAAAARPLRERLLD